MKLSHFLGATLCVVFLLVPALLNAQEVKSFGVKGGVSFANLWGEGTKNLNDQIGTIVSGLDEKNATYFAVSLFSSREILPELLWVQTEIMYTRYGKAWSRTIGGSEVDFDLEIDYIEMPWLLKFKFPYVPYTRAYVGPHLALMFRSRFDNAPSELAPLDIFSQVDVTGNKVTTGVINTVDIGLTTGLEIAFPAGPGSIIIDGRYTLGAVDIFGFSEGSQIRNYSFIVMGGYAIEFGGGF